MSSGNASRTGLDLSERRPVTAALANHSSRPLWSVLIPTRNNGDYLRIALESVLSQNPAVEDMEIIVMDDCSESEQSVRDCVRPWGSRVQLIRHNRNVGKCANYQSGISASRGKLLHLLHGDDFVYEGFYHSMAACFAAHADAGAFFCESDYVNAAGHVTGRTGCELPATGIIPAFSELLYVRQRIQTPSIVVRRQVYESLGGFDHCLTAFEDWEMWFRIALAFPIGFNAEGRAAYRISEGNTSTQSILSGRRTKLLHKTLQIMDDECPEELRRKLGRQRSLAMADYLMNCLKVTVAQRAVWPWMRIVLATLRFDCSARRVAQLLLHTLRLIYRE